MWELALGICYKIETLTLPSSYIYIYIYIYIIKRDHTNKTYYDAINKKLISLKMYTLIHAELGTILKKCIIDTITITHFFLIIDTTTITLKKIIVDTITNT